MNSLNVWVFSILAAIEFPKVNYEKFNGKPYQYFYGIGGTDLEVRMTFLL